MSTVKVAGRTFDLIGWYRAEPPMCSGSGHLPGAFNPWMGETACLCGSHWWVGDRGSWHARRLYDGGGQGARFLGFDVFYLPAWRPTRLAHDSEGAAA